MSGKKEAAQYKILSGTCPSAVELQLLEDDMILHTASLYQLFQSLTSAVRKEEAVMKKTIIIFRPWITKKDGTRLYAKSVGKKAFPIKISVKK